MAYIPAECLDCESRTGLKLMPDGSAYCTNCNKWARVALS